MGAITDEFLDAQIAATKLAITAASAGELALMSDSIQSYSLDTGQTRQMVTKANIGSLRLYIDSLYNRLVTLDARRNGGCVRVTPGW
jgi:hypothetical protein